MKKKILILGTVLSVVYSMNLLAQATNVTKLGALNVLRVIVECAEGKQANEDYQKKFEAKRNELEKKQQELQDLQQQLRTQASTLNEEARVALSKNIDLKTTELQRAQEDAEKEFAALRNEIFNRIGTKLAPVVQQYAREYTYTLILDSSSQPSQIVYNDPAIDITDDIIKRYDLSQISSKGAAPVAPKAEITPRAASTAPDKTN